MNATSKLNNYEKFSVACAVRKAICQSLPLRHCANPGYRREMYAEIRTLISALRKLRHA